MPTLHRRSAGPSGREREHPDVTRRARLRGRLSSSAAGARCPAQQVKQLAELAPSRSSPRIDPRANRIRQVQPCARGLIRSASAARSNNCTAALGHSRALAQVLCDRAFRTTRPEKHQSLAVSSGARGSQTPKHTRAPTSNLLDLKHALRGGLYPRMRMGVTPLSLADSVCSTHIDISAFLSYLVKQCAAPVHYTVAVVVLSRAIISEKQQSGKTASHSCEVTRLRSSTTPQQVHRGSALRRWLATCPLSSSGAKEGAYLRKRAL